MQRRATLVGVTLMLAGMLLVGWAYGATVLGGTAPWYAPWGVAVGGSLAAVALFIVGAATRGALGRGTAILLTVLAALLVGAFGAALALRSPEGGEAIVFGLPRRLAIVFYGVGFAPLLVLPLAFARTFGRGERGA